jgi:hypothetical protein
MRPNASIVPHRVPAEPWASFLRELDELLKSTVELHCLGGFVARPRPIPALEANHVWAYDFVFDVNLLGIHLQN